MALPRDAVRDPPALVAASGAREGARVMLIVARRPDVLMPSARCDRPRQRYTITAAMPSTQAHVPPHVYRVGDICGARGAGVWCVQPGTTASPRGARVCLFCRPLLMPTSR